MGDDVSTTILGIVLMFIGVIVAILTGTKMVQRVRLLEYLPALQGYVIGLTVAIAFFIAGLLFFTIRFVKF